MNFNQENSEEIDKIHERTAKRILDVCKSNGGLYIKFGQQMLTVPVLPSHYLRNLKELLDQAPVVDFPTVASIVEADFGVSVDELFTDFERVPIASASIAQVHRATLRDGTKVAVKIQKPEIKKQIFWDMICYRILIIAFEKVFDLPLYWSADYIETHLRQEVDFLNEARNGIRCRENLPVHLLSSIHVPTIYETHSSRHVLTAEWIDGVPLTDFNKIRDMNLSVKNVMTSVVDLFADQIFRTGFIHCDPHSANILCRSHPEGRSWWNWLRPRHQIVVLDHGLYVQCTPQFTKEYAIFWKSLFVQDHKMTKQIAKSWGIGDSQMFATATLNRPYSEGSLLHVNSKPTKEQVYDSHMRAKQQVRSII